jgi:hypothetical protein
MGTMITNEMITVLEQWAKEMETSLNVQKLEDSYLN